METHECEAHSAHIKVEIIRPERLQSLLQSGGHVGMVRVPQLAGDEDVRSGDATVLDALPDLVLVHVDEGAIEVSVADRQGV